MFSTQLRMRVLRGAIQRAPSSSAATAATAAATAGKRARPDYVGMALFGSLVVGTFGLGAWQADRYSWKEALIAERERILAREPQDLIRLLRERYRGGAAAAAAAAGAIPGGGDSNAAAASALPVLNDPALHYTRVAMRGTFDHANEILIGPRVPPKRAHGGGMDIAEVEGESNGFIVVTPLILDDVGEEGGSRSFRGSGGGGVVLVNRGWIPNPEKTKFKTEPALRFTTGSVRVTGVVHPPEQPRMFSPPNDVAKRMFLWFDPVAAAQAVGLMLPSAASAAGAGAGGAGGGGGETSVVCPLIINQTEPCNPGMFPVMKDTSAYSKFHVGTETHATYAGTWFSLSAVGVAMTYIRFLR
jgi:surfeit locus 1 family protein